MMKDKLQKIIREAIQEVLAENVAIELTGTSGRKTVQSFKSKSEADQLKAQNPNIRTVTQLEEDTLAEAIKYKLADDYEDKLSQLPYANSEKRMRWINGTIEYINQKGPADVTTIAKEKFGVPQPRLADYTRDMIRLGILTPEQEGVKPRFMKTDDEFEEEPSFYDLVIGKKEDPLAYLKKGKKQTPSAITLEPEDDEEGPTTIKEPSLTEPDEETPEVEPEAGEIEKAAPTGVGKYSKEDFDDKYKYSDLVRAFKNLKDAERSYLKKDTGEPIASKETSREKEIDEKRTDIRNLIQNASDNTIELILKTPGGVPYFVKEMIKQRPNLSKDIKDLLAKKPAEPVAENYEYEIRQLQYRAGIIR